MSGSATQHFLVGDLRAGSLRMGNSSHSLPLPMQLATLQSLDATSTRILEWRNRQKRPRQLEMYIYDMWIKQICVFFTLEVVFYQYLVQHICVYYLLIFKFYSHILTLNDINMALQIYFTNHKMVWALWSWNSSTRRLLHTSINVCRFEYQLVFLIQ